MVYTNFVTKCIERVEFYLIKTVFERKQTSPVDLFRLDKYEAGIVRLYLI